MSPLLNTPYFKDNLHLLVFDEVHYVASWGATFRTAYNEIDSMLSLVPHKSVMAMTATSTKKLRADLSAKLMVLRICTRIRTTFSSRSRSLRNSENLANLRILEETFHHFKGLLGGKTQHTDHSGRLQRGGSTNAPW